MPHHIAQHTDSEPSSRHMDVVASASDARAEPMLLLAAGEVRPAGADIAEPGATAATARRLHRRGAPDLAYDDLGSGDFALLFMPGWCVSRRVFDSLPLRCSSTHRVLCLDWRGHGESGTGTTEFNDGDLVEDAIDVIRASGVRRVVPVALAHAGWIAIELRRRLGTRVEKMVLVDWLIADAPAPFMATLNDLQGSATWRFARDRLFQMWLHGVDCPSLQAFIPADMGCHDFAMWARAARAISNAYTREGSPLRALQALAPAVQVLHVYAQPDDPSYLSMQRNVARQHAWYHVHKVKASSHFPMFEAPGEIRDAISRFLAGSGTLPKKPPFPSGNSVND